MDLYDSRQGLVVGFCITGNEASGYTHTHTHTKQEM
jgi:hypothetical protein